MRKATVTYIAPAGDNRVVEMGGVTFFDGQPVVINDIDNAHLFAKVQINPHFDVSIGDDEPAPSKRKPGRPPSSAASAPIVDQHGPSGLAEQAAAPAAIGGAGSTPLPTVQPVP